MFSRFHCSKLLPIRKISAAVADSVIVVLSNKGGSNHHAASAYSSSLCAPVGNLRNLKQQRSPSNIKNRSYTVSYLVNSCGLSPEIAKIASKKIKFETPERPDLVLELLRNYGFNKTQISRLVGAIPAVLLFDSEKNLSPKLEFYRSIGISKVHLARDPGLLTRSLDNHIIPTYNFFKSVLQSDKKVAIVMKRAARINSTSIIATNIAILRGLTVPESNIMTSLTHFPESMMHKQDELLETITKVKEMGFNPLKLTFMIAINVLSGKGSELIWNRCCKAYKRWGWSDDDILEAFKKHPHCMTLSDTKIERTMDVFVNKMGCQSKEIAGKPTLLLLSLEKRIIPRFLVIQVLTKKGLIKKFGLYSVLQPAEKQFLERFVTRYSDQLPKLLSLYQSKVDILAL